MDPEVEDILVQLARDVDGSYPRLWSMYTDRLYIYVVQKIRNQEDARDILQDVFLRVYCALKRYPAERILKLKLHPWLYKIAENACLNYHTRGQTFLLHPLDTSEESPHLDIPDTSCEPPDAIVERHEERLELLDKIAKMPNNYREPLLLRFFKDMSNDEIATKLQQRVGTVKVHVCRGLLHLRQMLIKQQQEQGNSKEKKGTAAKKHTQQEIPAEYDHSQESHYQEQRKKHVVSDNN